MIHRISFLLGCWVTALSGCSVYTPDLLGKENPVSDDGGRSDTDAASMCRGAEVAQLPPRPDPSAVHNRQRSITCTMVQFKIDLGDRDPTAVESSAFLGIGQDLDHKCTTIDNLSEGECQLPAWASGAVDGAGGIDNTLGAIVQATRNIVGDFNSDNYSKALQNGGVNILFRATGYNGELDDDQMTVATYVTAPFNAYAGEDEAVVPAWGGEDVWPIASDSIEDPPEGGPPWPDPLNHPKFFDPNAYVSGGKLVASLEDADLRLEIGLSGVQPIKLDLRLSGASVICDMLPTDKGCGFVASHCVLAGRWSTDHLLHQLSQFPDPAPPDERALGSALCTDSPLYANFKDTICASTDVYSGVALTENVTCNALSMGVTWDTDPALMGDLFYMDPILPRCPENIEPSRDSCDPTLSAPDLVFYDPESR